MKSKEYNFTYNFRMFEIKAAGLSKGQVHLNNRKIIHKIRKNN